MIDSRMEYCKLTALKYCVAVGIEHDEESNDSMTGRCKRRAGWMIPSEYKSKKVREGI